jgi:hypothetical protein
MSQASYQSMLVRHMYELYRNGLQTDMCVRVNGRQNIRLHSFVVAHHSTFFATVTTTSIGDENATEKVVALNDVDCSVFRRVVVWMYTANVQIHDAHDALALLALACRLGVNDLAVVCVEHLDEADLSRNEVAYWELASRIGSEQLQRRVAIYTARFIRRAESHESCDESHESCEKLDKLLQRLTAEAVAELLNLDNLSVYLAIALAFRWTEQHAGEDAGAIVRRLRIEPLPFACVVRLLEDRRLTSAFPLLKQCIESRRAMLNVRRSPVRFVGVYDRNFDLDAPREWEKVIQYDPMTRTTTRLPDIPCKIGPCKCAEVDDSFFVFGARGDVFGLRNDKWHVVGYIPAIYDLQSMAVSVVGPFIVFVGETTVAFDTAMGAWVPLPPMNAPRLRCTATAIGGRMFVFGGVMRRTPPESGSVSLCKYPCPADEVFVMRSRTWKNLSTNIRRVDCTSVAIDKRIYILGGAVEFGDNRFCHVETAECYNTATKKCGRLADMNQMRMQLTCDRFSFIISASNARTVHVFSRCGRDFLNAKIMEKFDIVTEKWTQCGKDETDELETALAVKTPL